MQHGHKNIGLIAYLFTIIISVLVTLVIIQSIVVDRMRDGCERRQPIFREIESFIRDAASTRESTGHRAVADQYRMRADRIKERIVVNCDEAYPSIFPFID